MREQDSGNIVFYHSVSVLLLTASVFYSFLSHYQVAPQLHGKCYIQRKSPAMAHWHEFCSLKSAALQSSLCCQCFTMSRYSPHSPGFHRSSGLGFLASDSPGESQEPGSLSPSLALAPAPRTRDQSRSQGRELGTSSRVNREQRLGNVSIRISGWCFDSVSDNYLSALLESFVKIAEQKSKPQKYYEIYSHTIVHNFIFCGHVWYYHFTSAEAPGRVSFALLLLQTMLHNEMIVEKNTFPRKLLSVPSQIFSTLSKIYTTNKKDSSNIFIESITFSVKNTKYKDLKDSQ